MYIVQNRKLDQMFGDVIHFSTSHYWNTINSWKKQHIPCQIFESNKVRIMFDKLLSISEVHIGLKQPV